MIVNTIRSFVRRGRITSGQKRALDTLSSHYLIEYQAQQLNLDALFNRNAAKHVEIGFGSGDALIAMAEQYPENDYLGIDVYRSGIAKLLMQIENKQLTNIRVICANAVDVFTHCLPIESIDAVYLFFPDPWHKKRHHKRRLVQPAFIDLLASKMKSEAYLHLATDWEDYARQMLQVLDENQLVINNIGVGCFAPRLQQRPLTKFERRGQHLGHLVWDLRYTVVKK